MRIRREDAEYSQFISFPPPFNQTPHNSKKKIIIIYFIASDFSYKIMCSISLSPFFFFSFFLSFFTFTGSLLFLCLLTGLSHQPWPKLMKGPPLTVATCNSATTTNPRPKLSSSLSLSLSLSLAYRGFVARLDLIFSILVGFCSI